MSEQFCMDLTAVEVGKDDRGGYRPANFPWTDEHVELLRKLTDDGLAASAIGKELGCSRNAVIGKQHRIGVRSKRSAPQVNHRYMEPKPHKPRIQLYPDRQRKKYQRKPPMIFDNYQPQAVDVVPLNLTFAQLQIGQCKYPYGDRDFLFCGHPVVSEGPYCPSHHCLCYGNDNHVRGMERPDISRLIRKRKLPTVAILQTPALNPGEAA